MRLVGVGISSFDAQDEQLDLFASAGTEREGNDVIAAADKVRDRFGDGTTQVWTRAQAQGKGYRYPRHE